MSAKGIEDLAKNLKELHKVGQKKESELIKKRAELELAQEELVKLGVISLEHANEEIQRLSDEIRDKTKILEESVKTLQDLINAVNS